MNWNIVRGNPSGWIVQHLKLLHTLATKKGYVATSHKKCRVSKIAYDLCVCVCFLCLNHWDIAMVLHSFCHGKYMMNPAQIQWSMIKYLHSIPRGHSGLGRSSPPPNVMMIRTWSLQLLLIRTWSLQLFFFFALMVTLSTCVRPPYFSLVDAGWPIWFPRSKHIGFPGMVLNPLIPSHSGLGTIWGFP